MGKAKELSFEDMMAELDATLTEISDEATPLEQSISLYAKAAELIARAQKTLDDATVRIEEIGSGLALPGEEQA